MLSLESVYPPAHQLALDMLKVLNRLYMYIKLMFKVHNTLLCQTHVKGLMVLNQSYVRLIMFKVSDF